MKQSELKQWLSGISYELAFWNNVYRWKTAFDSMFCWSRYGQPIYLDGTDAQAFLSAFEHPVVYDVGCGMSYAHGNLLPTPSGNIQLEVHYIDPLARFYNKIKRRYKRDVPDIEFGMLEFLSATFGAERAHLIIICNALDHSANPMQGIMDALCTLQVGGCLYMCHHPNEAEAEHYKGFHKFNITEEQGECVIWNPKQRIVVDDQIKPFAAITTRRLDNGFIVSTIRKHTAMPDSANYQQQRQHDMTEMTAALIDITRRPLFATCQHVKYLWYNTIQFFVQLLPWEKRMTLRSIIYK